MIVTPGHNVSYGAALLVEMIFTFYALVSVVLHTAVSKKTKGNPYYGLAIWCHIDGRRLLRRGLSPPAGRLTRLLGWRAESVRLELPERPLL